MWSLSVVRKGQLASKRFGYRAYTKKVTPGSHGRYPGDEPSSLTVCRRQRATANAIKSNCFRVEFRRPATVLQCSGQMTGFLRRTGMRLKP